MPNILCDPARYRVRAAALGIAIFSAFLWSMPAGALAPEILRAGDIHTIVPPDTECSTITGKSHSSVGVDADCNAANGNAYVLAEFGSTFAGDGSGFAVARFSYFFVVEEVPGISEQSLVPIRLNVPIDWVYRLRNNDTTGLFNESSGNITIRLWGDPIGAPNGRGTKVIGSSQILTAVHQGPGCLTVPKTVGKAVKMALNCVVGSVQSLRSNSLAELSHIVEVGRTYNIELELRADINKTSNAIVALRAESANFNVDHPGLDWNAMILTVGTDAAALVADLQEQVDQLREDLENHTHNYLTGRGVGHNDTLAISSPAIIPGESATGYTATRLQSGPVTGRPGSAP